MRKIIILSSLAVALAGFAAPVEAQRGEEKGGEPKGAAPDSGQKGPAAKPQAEPKGRGGDAGKRASEPKQERGARRSSDADDRGKSEGKGARDRAAGEADSKTSPKREAGDKARAKEADGAGKKDAAKTQDKSERGERRDRADDDDRSTPKAARPADEKDGSSAKRSVDKDRVEKDRADKDRADKDRADKDAKRAEDARDGKDAKDGKRAGDARDAKDGKESTRADAVDRKEASERRRQAREDIREVRQNVREEERTRVRAVFTERREIIDRARVDLRIRVNIGTALPRRVALLPVPDEIVEVVPVYRSYRYVVVGEEICIVDPDTHVIVDVIHRDSSRRVAEQPSGRQSLGGPAQLRLTREEEDFILEHVDEERFAADVQDDLDLEVGVGLPKAVLLHRFPDVVVERIDKLKPYRFVVLDDDVVIVEPDKHVAAYVIDN